MIEQVITPVAHDLGQFEVRRAIPSKARTMVGPFIFVDQFGPAQLDLGAGMDVRPHPHINLATVTCCSKARSIIAIQSAASRRFGRDRST